MYKLSLKMVMANKIRTCYTCAGVFMAVIMLVLGTYFFYVSYAITNYNFEKQMQENDIMLNEVWVLGASYYETDEKFEKIVEPIHNSTIKAIKKIPGVQNLTVNYKLTGKYDIYVCGYPFERVGINGIDAKYDAFLQSRLDLIKGESIVAGEALEENEENTLLISETMVKAMNMTNEEVVGEELLLVTEEGKEYKLIIKGVFAHGLSEYAHLDLEYFNGIYSKQGGNFMGQDYVFNSNVIKQIQKDRGITEKIYPDEIAVSMDSIDKIENFVDEVSNEHSLSVSSVYYDYLDEIKENRKYAKLITTIGIILLILVLIMIANTMIINISQQTRFRGLLSLMGFSNTRIHRMYLYQGSIYGFLGSIIGGLLSYALTLMIATKYVLSVTEEGIDVNMFILPVYYVALIVCIIGVASGIISYIVSMIQVKKNANKK